MILNEIAKQAVENYIKAGKIIIPKKLPLEFLNRKSGVFVTIEEKGALRGCIGTYLPTKANIAEETAYNAVAAATEDCRFEPVKEKEFSALRYTIYILNKPVSVKSLKELDPKKYGIIVKNKLIGAPRGSDVFFDGHFVPKTGILLPDLEGVDTIEQQFSIACQKAGINPEKEKILIYKFTVEKYK